MQLRTAPTTSPMPFWPLNPNPRAATDAVISPMRSSDSLDATAPFLASRAGASLEKAAQAKGSQR